MKELFRWETKNNIDCAVEVKVLLDKNNHLKLKIWGGCWETNNIEIDLDELRKPKRGDHNED